MYSSGAGNQMNERIAIQMIGAPIGVCGGGIEDAWRSTARLVARQIERYFGDQVSIEYFDLLDPNCPQIPPDGRLPLVLVNGRVLTSGDKFSTPALRRHLEEMGVARVAPISARDTPS